VTLLGVLKAGAAYVPLDPEYPAERLAYLVRDSGAAQLVTHSSLAERVEGADALLVDRLDLAPFSATRPGERVGPENLAYVIYTSGSTGKPKGAMNTHAAVMNRLLWMQEAVSLRPGEGVMQKAALGFDVAVWELLLPLMYGARVVLTRPGGQRDPEYLCERVESAGIAVLHFVPSLLPPSWTRCGRTHGGCARCATWCAAARRWAPPSRGASPPSCPAWSCGTCTAPPRPPSTWPGGGCWPRPTRTAQGA
jgi:non-ribosomal peptide synthetase component F